MRAWVGVALVALLGACAQSGGDDASDASSNAAGSPTSAAIAPVPLPEPVQELRFDATEYSFAISPDPSAGLKPGWTLLTFHNLGAEPHQAMFAHIKDGVDLAELAAAGAGDSSGAGAIDFVDMVGGVSYIGSGQNTTAMVNLTEGLVMAMCYVPDANGVAHALMGMTTPLVISAPTDTATAPPVASGGESVVGTITLSEDGYQLPDEMGAGWYRVRNTDSAVHELALLRLGKPIADEQTKLVVEDLAANRTPSVTVEAVGGMGAISPGFDGYLYLDLEQGEYLVVDFMPDPGEPRPHMLDGYYTRFSI